MTKFEFKTISIYYQSFLQNFFLYQHYHIEDRRTREEYVEWLDNYSNEIIQKLSNLKDRALDQEEITSVKKLNTFFFSRISDKSYTYIKNRVYLIFMYSEFEHYFFKCMKHLYMKKSYIEEEAENETINIIMKNSWSEIFNMFKVLFQIDHNLKNKLIEDLDDFRIIRNIFVHGNGVVNQIYIKRFPNTQINIGEKLVLNTGIRSKYTSTIIDIIPNFDEPFLKKCPELEFIPDIE